MNAALAPWWERWPRCYEQELRALEAAGYQAERDDAAFERGIVRLRITVPTEQFGQLRLTVTYPDLYPYFRPQIAAPDLGFSDLPHHLHPFGRTLCLLGRDTGAWHASWTAARLIGERLETALVTGSSPEVPAPGVEQVQAEPLSTYPHYPPATVLVPPGLRVDPFCDSGRFTVGLLGPVGLPPKSFLRGVVLKLTSGGGEVLAEADPAVVAATRGSVVGRWQRLDKPIVEDHAGPFLAELFRRHPSAQTAPANAIDGGDLKLWGVVYPDEIGHRERGDGWMFACEITHRPPPRGSGHQPKKPRNKKGRR